MPHKPLLSALLSLWVFATSCGPLVPLNSIRKKEIYQQDQIVETSAAKVWLQYIGSKHGYYIFDLEVENRQATPLSVAPQNISFYASPKKFSAVNTETNVHALSSLNSALPHKRLFASSPADTRSFFYKRVQAKKSGAFLIALLGIGLAVYDAAKDAEDANKETWSKKDERRAIGRDLLVSTTFIASEIAQQSVAQAEEDSYYIPFELFPECTIAPQKHVRGKIFIRKDASYRYSRVVIPINATDYVFDFRRKDAKN